MFIAVNQLYGKGIFVSTRRARQRSLLRLLMLPLTVALVVLVSGAGASLAWQYKRYLDNAVNREITEVPQLFAAALKQQAMTMTAELRAISRSDEVRQALKNHDRELLLKATLPLFDQLRQQYGITKFYFHTPARDNLIRIHLPHIKGGRIERFTFLEAERTGRVASGIELGTLGAFTLRAVQPVFEEEVLIGYVELGKEIENILQWLHTPGRVELALSIRKDLLSRQRWEEGMRQLGREADWDLLPDKAFIYSSLPPVPPATGLFITDISSRGRDRNIDLDMLGRTWRVAFLPSSDASGTVVGDFIIMYDISEQKVEFLRLLVMTGAGMLILLGLLLGFFHVVLSRADRQIIKREQEILASETRYRLLFRNMSAGFALHEIILDASGKPCDYRFLEVNPAFEQLTGLKAEELLDRRVLAILPDTEPHWIADYGKVALTGQPNYFENYSKESGRYYKITAYAPQTGRFATIFTDITRQKEAEEERRRMGEQLRQAQKMEAIGRLAGGVAHDFNNKLQTIFGYTDLALKAVGRDHPISPDLNQIREAARHAAELTRQLLAFARKQAISPQVLDLNETIVGMLKMLGRLLGEEINLNWQPGGSLWPVKMDPVQIDQILANLAVNSRDAITGIGRITIETANAELDETYCASNPGSVPGQYVLLAVSDNGAGIDREILPNIFEPFFTTKEQGKGTGLGLATVYGIVKQNNGFINVDSEPGQGTVFKIYLPRAKAKMTVVKPSPPRQNPTGTETVLLVEDEKALLGMARNILDKLGYNVLAAASPKEALRLAEEYDGKIQLLVTDVVLPEMNGRDLCRLLSVLQPDIRCLFMSGYSANIISRHGVLDEGVHFLQKPFSLDDFAIKLREALES
jgi:PAS domain S-box-containing protein